MSELQVHMRLDGTLRTIQLETGVQHTAVVVRPTATLLQALDVHFGNERVVFLPGHNAAVHQDAALVTGVEVAAAVFQFAAHNSKRLLVVGHADALGAASTNLTVSADRADNILLYLAEDAAAWASHCQGHFAVDDIQNILKWVQTALGWPTDPGAIDNDMGKQTRGALRAFRHEFNIVFEASIPEGPISEQDWEAIFQLYDAGVAEVLDPSAPRPEDLREAVETFGQGRLACGEAWPRDQCNVAGYPAGEDRRVDILFFDEDEADPEILLNEEPPGTTLYELGRAKMKAVPLNPVPFGSNTYEVWARISSHWFDQPVGDEPYVMVGPNPHTVVVREGTTTSDGEIHEADLPDGNYEIEIAGTIIPVAARIPGPPDGGAALPSDLRLQGLEAEHRPLHGSEEALPGEWIVPEHELTASSEEPDLDKEDGAPSE